MKASKNSEKVVDVSRGLPSVNETRKKRSYTGLIVFVLIVLFLGGGAAFFVYLKVKDVKQNVTKPAKAAEEKPATKPRVFGLPASEDAEGSVAAPAAGGSASGVTTVPNPMIAGGAPPVPPPLGARNGAAPPAPAEATVPAIGVVGGAPARPAPLNGGVAHAGGARQPGGAGQQGVGGALKASDDRSRYDTPFVVNGALQPGGRGGASSPLEETIRKGNEALATANGQGGASSIFGAAARPEGAKGALTGMLTPTNTPMVRAGMLGNQNLTVRKGTPVECGLTTRIVAMLPGLIRCTLSSPLFSANGKVVLADRGSEVVGEQSGTLRQGQTRLYVLWSEINTPEGVTIPIDSPGADALGAAGLDGEVDNHWEQRIGASLMLSLIDDAFAYEIAKAGSSSGTGGTTSGVAFQGTQQQSQRIAEKVLDSTINIPPTLYKKQGDKISIIIMRHLDFSSVYTLEPK